MKKKSISRREFLKGCSAAIAGLAGSHLTSVALANPLAPEDETHEILIVLFIRGGWDALNVIQPLKVMTESITNWHDRT